MVRVYLTPPSPRYQRSTTFFPLITPQPCIRCLSSIPHLCSTRVGDYWKVFSHSNEEIIHPETAAKINFVKKKDYIQLHTHIDPAQLEEVYGGTHPNLTSFWPVINSLKPVPLQKNVSHDQ
jgi:CRAL/TRIO domain